MMYTVLTFYCSTYYWPFIDDPICQMHVCSLLVQVKHFRDCFRLLFLQLIFYSTYLAESHAAVWPNDG